MNQNLKKELKKEGRFLAIAAVALLVVLVIVGVSR